MLDFGRYRRQRYYEDAGDLAVYIADDGEREVKVYVARDIDLDVASFARGIAALKQLPPGLPVARVLDGGAGPSLFWLAMEKDSGPTWAELFAQGKGSPGPLTMVEPVLEVARTLEAVHGAGLIHGCFGPESVVMKGDGSWVVTGLGVTPLLRRPISRDERYRAPEHYRQTMALDPRTDVYGLGVTLYQMMTLTLPYLDRGAASLRSSILSEPLCPEGAQIPERFREIVVRATAKEPADRFSTLADMRQALAAACQELAASVLSDLDILEHESGERQVNRTDPPAPDTLRSMQLFRTLPPPPPVPSDASPAAGGTEEITPPAMRQRFDAGMPTLGGPAPQPERPAGPPRRPYPRRATVALPSWIAAGLTLVAVAATLTGQDRILVYVQPLMPSGQPPGAELPPQPVEQAAPREPSATPIGSPSVAPPLPPAPAHFGQPDESKAVASQSCALAWYRCTKR